MSGYPMHLMQNILNMQPRQAALLFHKIVIFCGSTLSGSNRVELMPEL